MTYIKIEKKSKTLLSSILGAYQSENLLPTYECKWSIYLMSLPLAHLPSIPSEHNVIPLTYPIFTKPLPENCFLYQFTPYQYFVN